MSFPGARPGVRYVHGVGRVRPPRRQRRPTLCQTPPHEDESSAAECALKDMPDVSAVDDHVITAHSWQGNFEFILMLFL